MEKTYFDAWTSGGEIRVIGPLTAAEFQHYLEHTLEINVISPEYQPVWLDKMPASPCPWPRRGHVLIEGRIVVPRPVKVVTEYELP